MGPGRAARLAQPSGRGAQAKPRRQTNSPASTSTNPGGRRAEGSNISEVLGDIYRVEAYPDRNALVVISKDQGTSLDYLDAFHQGQRSAVMGGWCPQIVPLQARRGSGFWPTSSTCYWLRPARAAACSAPATGLTGQAPGKPGRQRQQLQQQQRHVRARAAANSARTGGGASGQLGERSNSHGSEAGLVTDQSPESSSDRQGAHRADRAAKTRWRFSRRWRSGHARRRPDKGLRPFRAGQVMISAIHRGKFSWTNELALGLRLSSRRGSPSSLADNSDFFDGERQGHEETNLLGSLFNSSSLDLSTKHQRADPRHRAKKKKTKRANPPGSRASSRPTTRKRYSLTARDVAVHHQQPDDQHRRKSRNRSTTRRVGVDP